MKTALMVLTMTLLLFGLTGPAAAEVLFGVSGEVGKADFEADYANGTDISESPTTIYLTGKVNLLGTRISLEHGITDMDEYTFTTTDFRIGWELGLSILRVKVFGGYEYYLFSDDTLSNNQDSSFSSLVVGVGAESNLGPFTIYGTTFIPVYTQFDNDATNDDDGDLSYFQLGVAYSPIPLVNLFVNYRTLQADSDWLDISSDSYTAGLSIAF